MRKFVVAAAAALLVSGMVRADSVDVDNTYEPCSSEWNQWVEERIGSRDNDGHGPDIGSREWQQVIQFRLKLNAKQVARLGSPKWCNQIDVAIRTDQLPRE